MNIAEKIKASIHAVHPDVQFAYTDEFDFNAMAGFFDPNGDYQFAVYVTQIERGNIIEASGQYRERVTVAVFFLMPAPYDLTGFDYESGIDVCKAAAIQWLAHLPLDDYIRGTYTATERVYNKYDDIFVGFGLRMEIQELVGMSSCDFES